MTNDTAKATGLDILGAALQEKNIKLKKIGAGTYRIDCPMPHCQTARKGKDDKTPLKLEIVSDKYAAWKCGHCLHTGHIGSKPSEAPKPEETLEEPSSRPPTLSSASEWPENAKSFLQQQNIPLWVIESERLLWDPEWESIRIPHFIDGKVVNHTLVNIIDGSTRLASSKQIGFVGLNKVIDASEVTIAQSELDWLRLGGIGTLNVISLPNAGSIPVGRDSDELDYFHTGVEVLQKAKRIVIAVSNNADGEKLRYEMARRIGAAKCWNVTWGDITLQETYKKRGEDYVLEDLQLAKAYPITGLYNVADFEQSLLKYFEGGMASGVSTGWANVDKYYTVMPCEMTVITGIPNSGKSEWLDALAVNLALAEGWRFAVFSPENGKEQHVTKLVEKRVEMSADPRHDDRMSVETFMSGASWVAEHFYFVVGDDEKDLPTLDWIMDKLTVAILRYGIKGAIIDPWNEIEHFRGATVSETEYISLALSKLKRFARNHGIHLWIVAHPAKLSKGKDGKFMELSLYDISGSANWANKTDNGIVIHREDEKTVITDVLVKKVRFKHVGRKGAARLKYSRVTGRYSRPDFDDQGALFSAVNEDELQSWEA